MSQVKVYRSFETHPTLEFRTYRTSVEASLDSVVAVIRLGATRGLELLEDFGKKAPQEYINLWSGKNPILDSTYAYLSPPNQEELNPREVTSYIVLPDGSLSKGKKEMAKTNWAEISVDAQKCLVAPHILAGKIVSLQQTEYIPEYWDQTKILGKFLRQYTPIGVDQSGRNWKHKKSGKIYETPEVLIQLSAIDISNCRFLNIEGFYYPRY